MIARRSSVILVGVAVLAWCGLVRGEIVVPFTEAYFRNYESSLWNTDISGTNAHMYTDGGSMWGGTGCAVLVSRFSLLGNFCLTVNYKFTNFPAPNDGTDHSAIGIWGSYPDYPYEGHHSWGIRHRRYSDGYNPILTTYGDNFVPLTGTFLPRDGYVGLPDATESSGQYRLIRNDTNSDISRKSTLTLTLSHRERGLPDAPFGPDTKRHPECATRTWVIGFNHVAVRPR
jgi:hypothetical protein